MRCMKVVSSGAIVQENSFRTLTGMVTSRRWTNKAEKYGRKICHTPRWEICRVNAWRGLIAVVVEKSITVQSNCRPWTGNIMFNIR